MTTNDADVDTDWEARLATLWAALDDYEPADFRAEVEALVAERPERDAIALFELGCVNDTTGRGDVAAPLYLEAMEKGLTGIRRRRVVIQRASTLRNLGELDESVRLLRAEREEAPDELSDALDAVLALSLVEVGREREAVGLAVRALAKHLPRYNRSMTNYAQALIDEA